MDGVSNITAQARAHSLANWWALAGVDEAVGDTPVNWLERDAKPLAAAETPAVSTKPAAASLVDEPIAPLADWPQDIESLKSAISSGALLPGNMFGGKSVAPIGPDNAQFMIVSDIPDRDELEAGSLGSGATGKLLNAMLAAIGVKLGDCYWTTLAATIPTVGELPDGALPPLADFARHQMELVHPKFYLLLGSAASKALLGDDVMTSRGGLRYFNHDVRNTAVLTTFHPRTLLARPVMKAEAWKDLQMFTKRDDL